MSILLFTTVLALGTFLFYGYSYRLAQIKRSCATVVDYTPEIQEITAEQVKKEKAAYDGCRKVETEYKQKFDLKVRQCIEDKLTNYMVWKNLSYELSEDKAKAECFSEYKKKVPSHLQTILTEMIYPSQGSNYNLLFGGAYCEEPTLIVREYKPASSYTRNAYDTEYKQCLRNNGL